MKMKHIRLRNGIPVILYPMSGTQVITALILFRVGSRNEQKNTNGVSHFVEHLFFKGTERRPTALDIARELDGLGADYNAFTGKDYTGYYVKVDSRHTETAVDMLEDMLFHPIFEADEINRERGVIVEEINMYEDNPMSISEELAEQLMFGAQHPLGYRIAGPKENIMRISRDAIVRYRDAYYATNNMVIVLAGNLPGSTMRMITSRFTNQKSTKRTPPPKAFHFVQHAARTQLVKKNTAQAHLALSFPGPTYTATEAPIAQVTSALLGGNMSSRLFISVRERQGLCYYIRSGVNPYQDAGSFIIQAGFDTKRIDQAVQAIIHELNILREHGITPEELQKAHDFIGGKMSIRFEDSEHMASWWGQQALFQKKMNDPEAAEKKIRAVTVEQVNAFIQKTFVVDHANLVVIGPYAEKQQKRFAKYLQQL